MSDLRVRLRHFILLGQALHRLKRVLAINWKSDEIEFSFTTKRCRAIHPSDGKPNLNTWTPRFRGLSSFSTRPWHSAAFLFKIILWYAWACPRTDPFWSHVAAEISIHFTFYLLLVSATNSSSKQTYGALPAIPCSSSRGDYTDSQIFLSRSHRTIWKDSSSSPSASRSKPGWTGGPEPGREVGQPTERLCQHPTRLPPLQ